MKDKNAVTRTRLGIEPIKMGTLTVTDQAARFTYEDGYADTGLRGLGMAFPAEVFKDTIV